MDGEETDEDRGWAEGDGRRDMIGGRWKKRCKGWKMEEG